MNRIFRFSKSIVERLYHRWMRIRVDRIPVDPRIRFPCYQPLDKYIDVARFQRMCPSIEQEIRNRIDRQGELIFDAGPYRLGDKDPSNASASVIWLTSSSTAKGYFQLDRAELWKPSDESLRFQPLMDFIETLPMKQTARVLLIFETPGHAAAAHRDHCETGVCHEFIWLRSPSKRFFCLNHRTGERQYIESVSAWFDTVHQYHGTETTDELSFSIRVDGRFSDQLRSHIPKNNFSPASTPSLWASLSNLASVN